MIQRQRKCSKHIKAQNVMVNLKVWVLSSSKLNHLPQYPFSLTGEKYYGMFRRGKMHGYYLLLNQDGKKYLALMNDSKLEKALPLD